MSNYGQVSLEPWQKGLQNTEDAHEQQMYLEKKAAVAV